MSLTAPTVGLRQKKLLPSTTADAFCLAELINTERQANHLTVVITANAQDALRLWFEIKFFQPQLILALLPDWETLPYDHFSPHQDLISERLASLWSLTQNTIDVLIIPATTALYRLCPVEYLAAYSFNFAVGQQLNLAQLTKQLVFGGYQRVNQVLSPGEFCLRGGLVDFFPMGSKYPLRLDLFDDEIESIRNFDTESQRSLNSVNQAQILPAHEFPTDAQALKLFRSNWRETFPTSSEKSALYQDISNGIIPAGCEYYLPLFFDKTATLFDYLNFNERPKTLFLHGSIEQSMQQFWQDTNAIYTIAKTDTQRPVLAPQQLFLNNEDFFTACNNYPQLALNSSSKYQLEKAKTLATLPSLNVDKAATEPLHKIKTYLQQHPEHKVLLIAETLGRQTSLLDFFQHSGLTPQIVAGFPATSSLTSQLNITIGKLAQGFFWQTQQLAMVTESELFELAPNVRRQRKQEATTDIDNLLKDLAELRLGDPIVHSQHGIGRYRGLINLAIGNQSASQPDSQEFLQIEYAKQANLYVPVSQLHLISRYTGVGAEDAPLHDLGGNQWDKARKKAAEQIYDTAAELLNIYAQRASRPGHAFRLDANAYQEFANDFGFIETPDQQAAINAVIKDMLAPQPMDRLVCGDVGFGKTEVALRAAFVATMAGKQVAFLAPTTLLAEQHFNTLVERFAKWPLRIAQFSRFRTKKETTQALAELASGALDIAVGTHKLLSSSVNFNRLGLLIIDEEHRFGVRQKEALKALRAQIDILTLTATPIPRTLGMAFEGLRDLSVIATSPQRRLSIKTFVRSESKAIIREAVIRELKRGGQVYFLHNEVETIELKRANLQQLLPEARIAVAHGQLPERQLEKVMRDFVAQRANLLLCSTIIETGIDVPNANTIIINRADKLGLAQLHQLRGRVGRSHHQAYAYLLVNEIQALSSSARKRLDAIQQMQELGAGFYLAMHDLEIRGAGEILGANQSGNMLEIGFQLYNEMLATAVQSLKNGQPADLMAPLSISTEVNLHAPCLLPEDYCHDINLRLSIYKRLASAKTNTHIDHILEELVDRFGRLPQAAQNLIATHRLRLYSQPFGVQKIDAAPSQIVLQFKANPPIDATSIIKLIQTNKDFRLAGNDKIKLLRPTAQASERLVLIEQILKQLKLATVE